MTDVRATEARGSIRFGWVALLVGAASGVVLETLHGFKVGPYLDDPLARLLLTLAHVHAVGLALVVLVYAVAGAPLVASRWPGRLLRVAAVLVPAGFAMGAFAHPEGDPNVAILLVPLGAAALVVGLALMVRAAFQSAPSETHGAKPMDR